MYRNILVPVDGSPTAECGLREAVRLARSAKAKLVLLHVVNELPAFANIEARGYGMEVANAMVEKGRRLLEKAQARAARLGVEGGTVLRRILGGPVAPEIVREAARLGSDLIVIGTHGRRGIRRLLLGSDAELVVRRSPVPVLLVRATPPGRAASRSRLRLKLAAPAAAPDRGEQPDAARHGAQKA